MRARCNMRRLCVKGVIIVMVMIMKPVCTQSFIRICVGPCLSSRERMMMMMMMMMIIMMMMMTMMMMTMTVLLWMTEILPMNGQCGCVETNACDTPHSQRPSLLQTIPQCTPTRAIPATPLAARSVCDTLQRHIRLKHLRNKHDEHTN